MCKIAFNVSKVGCVVVSASSGHNTFVPMSGPMLPLTNVGTIFDI